MRGKLFLAVALVLFIMSSASAQYFGQNKPNYEKFDFRVYQTPHFDLYNYLDNKEALDRYAGWAERWYLNHQAVLRDTIKGHNPILLYNDHADFQQTNAISGDIGVGTGGVTEALKNRVVLPIAMSNQQTYHVMGHELVHAFQYNMIINGDSTNLRNLGNLPLWLVEGLAEYMSIGSLDPHTAMWMRDAVLNDDVPSIDDLNKPKYFPYRYGQAFWAFLTGLKGDAIIAPFFKAVAMVGFEQACQQELQMSKKDLSKLWVSTLKNYYVDFLGDKKERLAGKELIGTKAGGEINIAPEISPNGRYLIFLTERNLFSLDLYLADARTGELLRKIGSSTRDGHIDDFNYIESSGTWSPDSRRFAFVAVSKGRNVLVIKEALTGKTVKQTGIKGLEAFSNPAWSPDGKTIVVSGLVQGQVDLFAYDVKSGKVTRLTNDPYSEMHPEWSADGSQLLFATDEQSFRRGGDAGRWTFNIAAMNMADHQVTHFDVFPGADNLNPVQDTSGNIIFLSDRDGFRNIYRLEPATGKVYQLTDLLTGVSGITPYAPAISIDERRDRLVYSYYNKNNYTIYSARVSELPAKEVDPKEVDQSPAQLPRVNKMAPLMVDNQLETTHGEAPAAGEAYKTIPYKSKFKLDYIGGSTAIGVGNSANFGTTSGAAGGIDMLFSDMIGNHQLFTSVALNGEVTDFGGVVAYINRKNKINWGGSLSHIPYRSGSGFYYVGLDTLFFDDGSGLLTDHYAYQINRLFEDKVGAFAQLPLSKVFRIESGVYYARYSQRIDQYDNYYSLYGSLVYQDRTRLPSPPGFNLWNVQAAIVGDNASFGLTSPLTGHRYRLGVDEYFGEYDFTAITADYRIYKFFKPVGFAFRAMHYGRYGGNSEDLFPLYVGSPWYVRGFNNLNNLEEAFLNNGRSIEELFGSKMLVSNFEIRLPFTGPKRLALIPSNFLFTDFNLFVDGGLAYFNYNQLNGNPEDNKGYLTAKPVFSAGASVRVNLFGALVLEPYYAVPLIKGARGTFGLNFLPGW